jgi:hypothetical protein
LSVCTARFGRFYAFPVLCYTIWIEEVGMPRGTRITVDLGSEELSKAVKFASVEQDKPIREIIIEALEQWLGGKKDSRQQDYLAI